MPLHSNAIILDDAVTTAVEWESGKKQHSDLPYFEITCAKNEANNVEEVRHIVTRSFCAPLEDRDRWVCEINQALLNYEKKKSRLRKQKARRIMDCDGHNVTDFRVSQFLPPVFSLNMVDEKSHMRNGLETANG